MLHRFWCFIYFSVFFFLRSGKRHNIRSSRFNVVPLPLQSRLVSVYLYVCLCILMCVCVSLSVCVHFCAALKCFFRASREYSPVVNCKQYMSAPKHETDYRCWFTSSSSSFSYSRFFFAFLSDPLSLSLFPCVCVLTVQQNCSHFDKDRSHVCSFQVWILYKWFHSLQNLLKLMYRTTIIFYFFPSSPWYGLNSTNNFTFVYALTYRNDYLSLCLCLPGIRFMLCTILYDNLTLWAILT